MKPNIVRLFLWFYLFYWFFGPMRDWANTGDFSRVFDWLQGGGALYLEISGLIAFFAYTLGAYLVFLRFFSQKKWGSMFLSLVAIMVAAIGLRYLLQQWLMTRLLGYGNYKGEFTLKYYFLDNLYYAIVFAGFGIIVFMVQYSQMREQQQKDLLIEQQKTALSLLRSQINPHFLFNALNNIYALISPSNRTALKAVDTLAGLLRYSLYERSEKVLLEKEMEMVKALIHLEGMRLAFRPQILLEAPDPLPRVFLPPFTLMPLMENVFKHALLSDAEHPVRVTLSTQPDCLIVSVANRVRERQKDAVGGIGLENLKNRLALIYRGKSDLVAGLDAATQMFTVRIQIPLEDVEMPDH